MSQDGTRPNPYGRGFTKLSPAVLYRKAPQDASSSTASETREPSLVLLNTWMDAQPRHISKYTASYMRLFPTAAILLITTSSSDFLIKSNAVRLNELDPALVVLQDLAAEDTILLHAFSNGGAQASWLLARQYRSRTSKSLPLTKTVLDSLPGKQGYNDSLYAFSLGIPNTPVVKILGVTFLRVFLAFWFVYLWVTGKEMIIDRVARGLNETELFDKKVARTYIYSTGDKLIRWNDVEEHARNAEAVGYRTSMVKYQESGHTAHMMKDEKRYWDAVMELWKA